MTVSESDVYVCVGQFFESEDYNEDDMTVAQYERIIEVLTTDQVLIEADLEIADAYRNFWAATLETPDSEVTRLARATHTASRTHRACVDEIIRAVFEGDIE